MSSEINLDEIEDADGGEEEDIEMEDANEKGSNKEGSEAVEEPPPKKQKPDLLRFLREKGAYREFFKRSSVTQLGSTSSLKPPPATEATDAPPMPAPIPQDPSPNASEQERYVKALMVYQKNVFSKEKGVWYSVWQCGRPGCRLVKTIHNTGFSNLYAHLGTSKCYGGEEGRKEAYEDAMKKKTEVDIDDIPGLSLKTRVVLNWVNLLLHDHLPLAKLSSKHFKRLMPQGERHLVPAPKTMRSIMMKLMEETESVIKRALPSQLALEHDGWSYNGRHYLALFASFVGKNGKCQCALLSMSPLAGEAVMKELLGDDDEEEDADNNNKTSEGPTVAGFKRAARAEVEAEKFDAQAHYDNIKLVLSQYYGKSVEENVVCFVGDNCNVNKKIAKIAKKPLVGCAAHRLNLEVERWLKRNASVGAAFSKVADIFVTARSSKNRTKIRNAGCELSPILHCKTRWSSKIRVIDRYFAMESALLQVEEIAHKIRAISSDERHALKGALVLFGNLDEVSRCLQSADVKLQRLERTRASLEIAKQTLEEFNNKKTYKLVMTNYKCYYLSDTSAIVDLQFRSFEAGVMKIQREEEASLSASEKEAVKLLLKPEQVVEVVERPSTPAALTTAAVPDSAERRKREQAELRDRLFAGTTGSVKGVQGKKDNEKSPSSQSKYVVADFIAGTSVRVERFFSQAKLVLPDSRKGMSPFMFEVFCFLKENQQYWSANEVDKAIKRNASSRMLGHEDATTAFLTGKGADSQPFDYEGDSDED